MIKNFKQLAVVVLFWNDSEKTIRCLSSLFKQKKQKFDIILVDNNSEEIFSKKILSWIKKKKFILLNLTKILLLKKIVKQN